jgi:hypothetical protein
LQYWAYASLTLNADWVPHDLVPLEEVAVGAEARLTNSVFAIALSTCAYLVPAPGVVMWTWIRARLPVTARWVSPQTHWSQSL